MASVIQIVAEHLRSIGADGLVCPDAECGCQLSRLAPCCSDISECVPGFEGPGDGESEWVMWATKERAEQERKARQWGPLIDPEWVASDGTAQAKEGGAA